MRGKPRLPSMASKRAVSSPQMYAPAPAPNLDIQREAAAHDSRAQQPARLGFGYGSRQDGCGAGIFAADEDIGFARVRRISRQRYAFQQEMRAMFHQDAVFESARLALVGIADDILGSARGSPRELPLHAGGEGRAATPDQARSFHLGDQFVRCHLGQCPAQGSVIAIIVPGFGAPRSSSAAA